MFTSSVAALPFVNLFPWPFLLFHLLTKQSRTKLLYALDSPARQISLLVGISDSHWIDWNQQTKEQWQWKHVNLSYKITWYTIDLLCQTHGKGHCCLDYVHWPGYVKPRKCGILLLHRSLTPATQVHVPCPTCHSRFRLRKHLLKVRESSWFWLNILKVNTSCFESQLILLWHYRNEVLSWFSSRERILGKRIKNVDSKHSADCRFCIQYKYSAVAVNRLQIRTQVISFWW